MWEFIDLVGAAVGMSRSEVISTTGAACGFLGGVLLAFAASRVLTAHTLAITALQLETTALVEAYADPTSPLYKVGGTEKHIRKGERLNTWLTRLGLVCLTVSLLLTIGAFFVPKA